MDAPDYLLQLLLILLAARVFAALATRMKSPSAIGELLAGVALGIILLLFEAGLIFAELGRTGGIPDNQVHAGMIIVIALTTLLPPFVMKVLYRHRNPAPAI